MQLIIVCVKGIWCDCKFSTTSKLANTFKHNVKCWSIIDGLPSTEFNLFSFLSISFMIHTHNNMKMFLFLSLFNLKSNLSIVFIFSFPYWAPFFFYRFPFLEAPLLHIEFRSHFEIEFFKEKASISIFISLYFDHFQFHWFFTFYKFIVYPFFLSFSQSWYFIQSYRFLIIFLFISLTFQCRFSSLQFPHFLHFGKLHIIVSSWFLPQIQFIFIDLPFLCVFLFVLSFCRFLHKKPQSTERTP